MALAGDAHARAALPQAVAHYLAAVHLRLQREPDK